MKLSGAGLEKILEQVRSQRTQGRGSERFSQLMEQLQQNKSDRLAAREARRSGGSDDAAQVDISPPPTQETTPAQQTQPADEVSTQIEPEETQIIEPPSSDASDEINDLATRYVDTYSQQSGRSLSAEERTAKIAEVADFYDDNQTRMNRLESLVNEIDKA